MYNKYKETPEKQIEQYHVEKQRSKQRLVGSIILLLFALLVLLAITAKIKPIAIPESTLEVHSTVIAIESQESTIIAINESEALITNTESNASQTEAVVTNTNVINNQPQANSQHIQQQAPVENNPTTETTVTQFKGGIIRTNNDVTTKHTQKTTIKPVVAETKKTIEPAVNKTTQSKIEKPKAEVKAVQQDAAPLQKAKIVAKQSNHNDDLNDDLIDSATAKKAATAKKPTKVPTQPSAPTKPKAKKTTNPDDILNGLE